MAAAVDLNEVALGGIAPGKTVENKRGLVAEVLDCVVRRRCVIAETAVDLNAVAPALPPATPLRVSVG